MQVSKIIVGSLIAMSLSGCTYYKNWQAPVSSYHNLHQGQYVVKRGDTLRSVAYGLNVSPSDLATWNNLKAPYQLFIGQTLYLSQQPDKKPVSKPTVHEEPAPKVIPRQPSRPVSKPVIVSSQKTHVRSTPVKVHHAEKPVHKTYKKPVTKPKKVVAAKPKPKPKPKPAAAKVSSTGWSWPAQGKASTVTQGVDIAVKAGSPVKAAKAGKVLYTGPDISGTGKMVIVSHANGYLSAYGYLSKISVKEGQALTRGATVGRSGTYQGKGVLHFEIRDNGTVKNPRLLLPS